MKRNKMSRKRFTVSIWELVVVLTDKNSESGRGIWKCLCDKTIKRGSINGMYTFLSRIVGQMPAYFVLCLIILTEIIYASINTVKKIYGNFRSKYVVGAANHNS